MSAEFDQIIANGFSHDELAGMSSGGTFFVDKQAMTEMCLTEARADMFAVAHQEGYSPDLYETMKRAGFTARYLSYLSWLGLSTLNRVEEI